MNTKSGDIYLNKEEITDYYHTKEYYLKIPDNVAHYYNLKSNDIYIDEETLDINWDNKDNEKYTWSVTFVNGCNHLYENLYVNSFNPSMGKKVGTTTKTNKPIYQVTDEKLLKDIYDYYMNEKDIFYEYSIRENRKDIPFEEYKNLLVAIAYPNNFGEYIILDNEDHSFFSVYC